MKSTNYVPATLDEAERLCYRAQCKVRCLESSLDRIDFDRFEELMDELEAAREESRRLALIRLKLRCESVAADYAIAGTIEKSRS